MRNAQFTLPLFMFVCSAHSYLHHMCRKGLVDYNLTETLEGMGGRYDRHSTASGNLPSGYPSVLYAAWVSAKAQPGSTTSRRRTRGRYFWPQIWK